MPYVDPSPSNRHRGVSGPGDGADRPVDGEEAGLIERLKEKRTALISHAVTKGLDPNVKMKDSGIEWLGQIPEHWRVSVLSS